MEENKVAAKLQNVLGDGLLHSSQSHGIDVRKLTDFILQSPDLRVTLVEPEPRFSVREAKGSGCEIYDNQQSEVYATDMWSWAAEEMCAWLNSKEPK